MSNIPTVDLEAYRARIGYDGPLAATTAVLHALHFRHVCAIPFENLDVLLDRTLSLDFAALQAKLIHARRGGYCYEQNTFFAVVLRQLGFRVTPLIARVRWQIPPEVATPRSHMILRVDIDGSPWITDVGFGSIGLSAPLRLEPDVEQASPHEPRRLIRRGDYWVHQVRIGPEWHDAFQFTPDEVPPIDYEVANWYSNRHPRSHFQNNLIVTRVRPEGRTILFNREFTLRERDGRMEKREITSPDELFEVLARHFNLHFPAGTRFGRPGSPWPR